MTIDIYSSAGTKLKSMDLPADLFESEVNWGLLHQAVTLQQANRRQSAAHVKTRGEVQGSTKKLFAQKGTGRARRGAVRSPLLRGGGKIFGPRNTINHSVDMPKKMRHAALRSALSAKAQKDGILGLENFADAIKTKTLATLLKKLPLEHGRNVLLVSPTNHKSLMLSARNIPSVKTVRAGYLNVEDVLNARKIVFLVDAIEEAQKVFGKKDGVEKLTTKIKKMKSVAETKKSTTKTKKTKIAKKATKKPSKS